MALRPSLWVWLQERYTAWRLRPPVPRTPPPPPLLPREDERPPISQTVEDHVKRKIPEWDWREEMLLDEERADRATYGHGRAPRRRS